MGTLLVMTIRASLLMAALYGVYRLSLGRSSRLTLRRVVLMSVYLLSGALAPLTAIGVRDLAGQRVTIVGSGQWPVAEAAVWIWVAGMAAMTLATLRGLWATHRLMRRGVTRRLGRVRVVLSDDPAARPMSAGRTVVISRADLGSSGHAILTHEKCHIRQMHTLDLAVARLAVIVAWFNPVAWLMARELAAVHEFQADRAVTGSGVDVRSYQMLLIAKACGGGPALVNSFGSSPLRRRIEMMAGGSRSRLWALSGAVPAVAAVFALMQMPAVDSAMNRIAAAGTSRASANISYYVDDTPINDLAEVNPSDIASITVDKSDGNTSIFIQTKQP